MTGEIFKCQTSFLDIIGLDKEIKGVSKNKSGKEVGLMISEFRRHWGRKDHFKFANTREFEIYKLSMAGCGYFPESPMAMAS